MHKIPARKRVEVLKLYFMGRSYDEIVKEAWASKDSVMNVIKELKEGRYPGFKQVLDLIDELRDIAVEIKKNNLEAS